MTARPVPSRWVFQHRTVFVTGATGFLGLALVVKLLRELPCQRVYLLVRHRERYVSFSRLEKTVLFTGPDIANICPLRKRFWNYYRQTLPQDQFESIRTRRDVSILDGDLSEPGLGLSEGEVSLLKNTVNIYIHLACSISLRRSVPVIAKSIINPTLELARIALASTSLERFVYSCTAYSNAHLHNHHQ